MEEIIEEWLTKLQEAKVKNVSKPGDRWSIRLERVRGQIGDDGVERISTQMFFDHLEILQRSRGAGAGRRLAKLMRELGGHRFACAT